MLCVILLLAATPPLPPESRQMLLSMSSGWDATQAVLQLHTRASEKAPWMPAGARIDSSLGRAGLAWGRGLHPQGLEGPQKREGDGRSPAGVFDLRLVTGYEPTAPPGTRLPYRQAGATLRCVDDPHSLHYNQLADEAGISKDWTSAEDMLRQDQLYRLVVWVGHNDAPAIPGGGSCIFLHLRASPQAVTSGCTAFELEPMQQLLRALDPEARPVLVQLPEPELRARAAAWGLPPPRSTRAPAIVE